MKQLFLTYKTTVSIVLIIFCYTVLGQQKTAIAQSEKETDIMVTQTFELWNEGNLAMVNELFDPNIIRHAVDIYEDIVGFDAYKEWVKNTRTEYPDFNVKTVEIIVKDDMFVWHWMISGTNTGSLDETPPTGKKMQISGVTISKITNEKISEQWFFWNQAASLKQLCFTFTPPSMPEGK